MIDMRVLNKLYYFQDAVIKLSDFGFAKVDDGSLTTPHFTPYYVAPQVWPTTLQNNNLTILSTSNRIHTRGHLQNG